MAQAVVVNNNLQEWNNEIKNAYEQLHPDEGGAVYIMSLTRRKQGIVGGVMSKVARDVAALHVAGETHREATPDEIAAWNADQLQRREKQLGEAAKREQKFNLDLGPIAEMLMKLGASAANAGVAQVAQAVAAAPVTAPPVPPAIPVPAAAADPRRTAGKGKDAPDADPTRF